MTTRSDGSAGASGRSLHGLTQASGGGNQSLDLIRDVYRYQLLYENVIYKLQRYTNLYSAGAYATLKSTFTLAEYNKIVVSETDDNYYNNTVDELIDFSYNSTTFSKYKSNMFSVLTGLQTAVRQYDQLNYTVNEFKQQEVVLTNRDKLIEYIKIQFLDKRTTDAFDISQPFTTEVYLKPWFSLYLQMYGAPPSGVFDAEKMANVVEILVKRGDITMSQFVSG
jgi:hypothetical protein